MTITEICDITFVNNQGDTFLSVMGKELLRLSYVERNAVQHHLRMKQGTDLEVCKHRETGPSK